MKSPDVLIIGGGVIGLTTAYYLARAGARVQLLDQGDFGQESSWAGAGSILVGKPKRVSSPLVQLRAKSALLFPQLSDELREQTGIDNGYVKCGGLDCGCTQEQLLQRARAGRDEEAACEVLDARQLLELEPALSPRLPGAVYFPDVAQVRNPRHLKALVAACGQLGVRLTAGSPVYSLQRQGSVIRAARCPQGDLSAGTFLIAAGAWSGLLMELVECSCPIRPVRGQIALLKVVSPLFSRVINSGPRYLVPRPDGRILVGSTEEEVGFDKHTTAEAIQGLLELARGLVPTLGQSHLERCWAGLRPGTPDRRPYLGQVPGWNNLFVASGHFRSGIQLSPGTAKVMTEALLGEVPSVPLDAFRLDR